MNARAFLVRGLLAGLLAGLATFLVALGVGEPHIETAIALEEAGSHAGDHTHDQATDEAGHAPDTGVTVSREYQRTWGLLTGSLAVGLALGGIVGLVSAATVGRLGRLAPGQGVGLVSLVGFVSVALVPFLKYPATPPAVGSGETIGDRTALYFGFVLLSVLTAVAATWLALRLRERHGTYAGGVAGATGYLVVVLVAGQLFASVDKVGDFPADTLWYFRRASLLTLAALWASLGVVLTGLVSRLHRQQTLDLERRALAASL